MTTDLATLTDNGFSREKIDLIKRTVAAGTTDDELQLFLYQAQRTGLDPLTRQIYAIRRWNKQAGREVMTIQTAIDGYRVIADRTGKLMGISDPIFDTEEGSHPNKATVTVRKLVDGHTAEFTATARWTEYVQTNKDGGTTGMWVKMAFLMLGKCAEALALRKAFPADLSGVYTAEEMAQADNEQQREAVFAEVEKQKGFSPKPIDMKNTAKDIPPELEWSYNEKTGVLICRPVEVKLSQTKAKKDYVAVKLNGKVGDKDFISYFHSSHRNELLAATGKVCKFMVVPAKGGYFNIDLVVEIDGKRMPDGAAKGAPASPETEARLLASMLEWSEDRLMDTHVNWCDADWSLTLADLKKEQARKAQLEEVAQ